MMINRLGVFILLFVFLESTAVAGSLEGKFDFKKRPAKGAVIYFSDDSSASTEREVIVDQTKKQFNELIVVAPKGAKVRFKNSDAVRHNVYARNKAHNVKIDIGFLKPGEEKTQEVGWNEGIAAKMKCKIHASMQAWVFLTSSQYYKAIDFKRKKKTSFVINDVPDSLSKITIWMTDLKKPLEVELPIGQTIEIKLKKRKKVRGTLTLTRKG